MDRTGKINFKEILFHMHPWYLIRDDQTFCENNQRLRAVKNRKHFCNKKLAGSVNACHDHIYTFVNFNLFQLEPYLSFLSIYQTNKLVAEYCVIYA